MQSQSDDIFFNASKVLAGIDEANEEMLQKKISQLLALKDEDGNTLLHYLTAEKQYVYLSTMISIGFSPFEENYKGLTSLMIAFANHDLKALTIFISNALKQPYVIPSLIGIGALQGALYMMMPDMPISLNCSISFSSALLGYALAQDGFEARNSNDQRNL